MKNDEKLEKLSKGKNFVVIIRIFGYNISLRAKNARLISKLIRGKRK